MSDNDKETALKNAISEAFKNIGGAVKELMQGDTTLDELIDRAPIQRLKPDTTEQDDNVRDNVPDETSQPIEKTL